MIGTVGNRCLFCDIFVVKIVKSQCVFYRQASDRSQDTVRIFQDSETSDSDTGLRIQIIALVLTNSPMCNGRKPNHKTETNSKSGFQSDVIFMVRKNRRVLNVSLRCSVSFCRDNMIHRSNETQSHHH